MTTLDKQGKHSTINNMSQIAPSKVFIFIVLPLVITLAAIGVAYYFHSEYQRTKLLLQNPQEAAKQETRAIVREVGDYMELPIGEEPTLATVLDAKQLAADQAFFKRAKNGDKLLIYIKAKQAILYRRQTKKIIAVSPLTISNNQSQQNVAGETTEAEVSPTPSPILNSSPPPTR